MESKPLDEKWLELLKELVESGVSKEDFKYFLAVKKAAKKD